MKTLLILAVIIFTSNACKEDNVEKTKLTCGTFATVLDLRGLDGCGFVFELADGKRLEPQLLYFCGTPPLPKEATENPLSSFVFVDGKKVTIGYEVLENQTSICKVGPMVKIMCIEEVKASTKE